MILIATYTIDAQSSEYIIMIYQFIKRITTKTVIDN